MAAPYKPAIFQRLNSSSNVCWEVLLYQGTTAVLVDKPSLVKMSLCASLTTWQLGKNQGLSLGRPWGDGDIMGIYSYNYVTTLMYISLYICIYQ